MVGERIAGVFEGGGAKGLAYAGALEELEAQGVAFEAVAGASAGAITAALIAAGCGAAELRASTGKALAAIDLTSKLRAVGRLRDPTAAGLARTDDLRTVIQETMAASLGIPAEHDPITFDELHEANGIELFVVAVDTYVRQHLVFHHRITPGVSVVDAVVASSSIPLVFGPSRAIRTLEGVGTVANAVVDGGVWTNFPLFVFTDLDFRRYHGLGPKPETIIGFQLAEPKASPDIGEVTQILPVPVEGAVTSEELIRRGWKAIADEKAAKPEEAAKAESSLADHMRRFVEESKAAADDPFKELEAPPQISAYPRAHGELARTLQGYVESGLDSLHHLPYAVPVAVACIAGPVIGLVVAGRWVIGLDGGWEVAGWVFFIAIVVVAVGLMAVSLIGVLANALLLHPLRRLAYPVGSTYGAASGVPYWLVHSEDHPSPVIALPIDPALTTLAFDPDPTVIDTQIAAARAETARRLREILDDGTSPAPHTAS